MTGVRGRLGLYGPGHVQRLQLIARLQCRGYSLAGILDLLGAWESGTDLGFGEDSCSRWR
jgi:DNA-binding transcriptional MerR regulator